MDQLVIDALTPVVTDLTERTKWCIRQIAKQPMGRRRCQMNA
jgi:hypothetical protein